MKTIGDNEALTLQTLLPALKAANKFQTLQFIAQEAGRANGVNPAYLARALARQERTDTSGIGDGIALPHLSLYKLNKPYTLFAKLTDLIDFDALDGRPVDMVFLLLSPKSDGPLHLRRLSRVTRLLKNRAFRENLRATHDRDLLYTMWKNPNYILKAA